MSSRFLCECGQRIDKNLFSGNEGALLVAEEAVDQDLAGLSAKKLVHELILRSHIVVTCKSCERLYVIDESGRHPARIFFPERH